jgi:hypothetical protein
LRRIQIRGMVAAPQIAPEKRIGVMNNQAGDPDQTDEEVLTYTVSDEALEAAGDANGSTTNTRQMSMFHCCC